MNEIRVLVVDDEPDMLDNCRRLLSRQGYTARTLQDPTLVQQMLHEDPPHVILLDLKMPQVDGMTVLATVLAHDATLPVIIMTAFGSVASAVGAIREGAFDYLTKPFSREQLAVAVDRAVRYRRLVLENRALHAAADQSAVEQLIGQSPALIHALSDTRRVAPSEANVLILGESGTGKELIARCVHEMSARAKGRFMAVDCASLPEALLESELFGHERGAFTGAIQRKRGLLVEAGGGTVFLDEIGELSSTVQAKLLRALEARTVRSVGGTQEQPIDVRFVAATNVDLEAAVHEDRFRSDLYYRLNVVQVVLPPLRGREGDISLLLDHFLSHFSHLMDRPPPQISPNAQHALDSYSWPGNVRELRNLAHRLVVLDEDGIITVSDLPLTIRGKSPERGEKAKREPLVYEVARDRAMTTFLGDYVRRLLDAHGGNISKAAETAGVSRRTVHRWVAELEGTDSGVRS